MRSGSPRPLIPHLKLRAHDLPRVLEAVGEYQPSRPAVSAAITRLFPEGVEEKSVVRGMAIPATTRLHLVRATDDAIELAPNGVGFRESGLPGDQFLAVSIRAVAARRFSIPPAFLQNLESLVFNAPARGLAREPFLRFAGYLRQFPVLPAIWNASGFRHFPDGEWRCKLPRNVVRREVLTVVGPNEMATIDSVRTRLLRQLWSLGWLVTSFDIDDALVALAADADSSVRFWRAASRGLDELLMGGTPYRALTIENA